MVHIGTYLMYVTNMFYETVNHQRNDTKFKRIEYCDVQTKRTTILKIVEQENKLITLGDSATAKRDVQALVFDQFGTATTQGSRQLLAKIEC